MIEIDDLPEEVLLLVINMRNQTDQPSEFRIELETDYRYREVPKSRYRP